MRERRERSHMKCPFCAEKSLLRMLDQIKNSNASTLTMFFHRFTFCPEPFFPHSLHALSLLINMVSKRKKKSGYTQISPRIRIETKEVVISLQMNVAQLRKFTGE